MPESSPVTEFEQAPVDAIVGREPSWIVNSGTGLVAAALLVLLAIACFIRYPDTLNGQIKIASVQPPAELIAKVPASIAKVYVKANDYVAAEALLIQLRSDTNLVQLQSLLNIIEQYNRESVELRGMPTLDQLGDIQPAYHRWTKLIAEARLHRQSDEYRSRQLDYKQMQQGYRQVLLTLSEKKKRLQNKLLLQKQQLENNRLLHSKGLLSDTALLPLENQYLDQQIASSELDLEIRRNQMDLDEAKRSARLAVAQHRDKQLFFDEQIEIERARLNSEIENWRYRYQVRAPKAGMVSMPKLWRDNQHVDKGTLLLNIVNPSELWEGQMIVKHQGVGKIEKDQTVEIELESYPAREFGKLVGYVDSVSLVPSSEGYLVTVKFEDVLTTTYNTPIKITPNQLGFARIVTKPMSFATRLVQSVAELLS